MAPIIAMHAARDIGRAVVGGIVALAVTAETKVEESGSEHACTCDI